MIENNDIGFLKSGKYRKSVLELLRDNSYIPKEIADKLGTSTSQISRTLKELQKHELIFCITPDRSKGKIFRVTEKGILLLNFIGEK